ncbi:MAG TPA: cupin domain-containing protein [Stellaceae bacterium]|nr:cupin domain-containing protein [Stellaceae bacterium]
MPATPILIRHAERPVVDFGNGATYCPLIGDDNGAGVPLRTGIQTSPPGYETRPHSHPYVETLTVLEGDGEAWVDGENEVIALKPGVTIALPANRVHGFRAIGDRPLITFGVHASGQRIVDYVTPAADRVSLCHASRSSGRG